MKNRVRGLASRTSRLVILTASATLLPIVSAMGAQWHSNFEEALSTAQKQNKPILIDFSTTWCGYCKQLDATTFKDPSVLSILDRSFVRVKVDGEARADLASRYQVKAYPTIVFLDPNGNSVKSEAGFIDSRQMVSSLSGVERQLNPGAPPSTAVVSAPSAKQGLAARLLGKLPGGAKPEEAKPIAVASNTMTGRTRYGGGQVYADGNQPAPAMPAPNRARQDTLATAEILSENSQATIEQDLKIAAEPETLNLATAKPKETPKPAPVESAVKAPAATEPKIEQQAVSMYNLPVNSEAPKPLIARSVADKIVGTPAETAPPALLKKKQTDAEQAAQLGDQLATIRKLQGLEFPKRREIVSLPSGPKTTATDAGSSLNTPVKMKIGVSEPPVLKVPEVEPPPLPAPDTTKAAATTAEVEKKTDANPAAAPAEAPKTETSTGAKKEDVSRWFADANTKLKDGHRREARAMFSKVVENDPENISGFSDMAYVRMAALIVEADDDKLRKQAHSKIKEFEARYPDSDKKDYYTLVRAILAVDLGEKDEAMRLLEDYPERFPNAQAAYKKQAYDVWKSTTSSPTKTTKSAPATAKSKSSSTSSKSTTTADKSTPSKSGTPSKTKTSTSSSNGKKVATR